MGGQSLKTKILLAFFLIIGVFAVSISFLGAKIIQNDIIDRAQKQMKSDLVIARSVFQDQVEAIKGVFNLITPTANFGEVREKMGLDYLSIVNKADASKVKSEIVQRAFYGTAVGGIRIIDKDELQEMGEAIYKKTEIPVRPTSRARPSDKLILDKAMAIGYAMPVFDAQGKVQSVIYGGKIVNRDFSLVDKIRDLLFENKLYNDRPLGTVTVFLDDVRIATNVLDNNGARAIGTRVSETVYRKVVEEGTVWLDRAFVVNDWYLTAYEPIRTIKGDVVGILYVGILEKPFKDMEKNIFLGFLLIVGVVSGLAAVLSYILANAIARPVTVMLEAAGIISKGNLEHRVEIKSHIQELRLLADAFNDMAQKLKERQESYLDLIGFVSHELKGILSSTILNAYAVRDGFLGLINFKQRKALDSVSRNLDYLDATVKNFLNLSRIEKGETALHKTELCIKEDVFDIAIEAFSRAAHEKGIRIINAVEPRTKIKADPTMLQIAANNLIGNAVKYGLHDGRVIVSSQQVGNFEQIEVYNDGTPITIEEKSKLFRKFSRLESAGRKTQGTGLGLFITKEIIEQHKGKIWVEVKETGNAFVFQLERGP